MAYDQIIMKQCQDRHKEVWFRADEPLCPLCNMKAEYESELAIAIDILRGSSLTSYRDAIRKIDYLRLQREKRAQGVVED